MNEFLWVYLTHSISGAGNHTQTKIKIKRQTDRHTHKYTVK